MNIKWTFFYLLKHKFIIIYETTFTHVLIFIEIFIYLFYQVMIMKLIIRINTVNHLYKVKP